MLYSFYLFFINFFNGGGICHVVRPGVDYIEVITIAITITLLHNLIMITIT